MLHFMILMQKGNKLHNSINIINVLKVMLFSLSSYTHVSAVSSWVLWIEFNRIALYLYIYISKA